MRFHFASAALLVAACTQPSSAPTTEPDGPVNSAVATVSTSAKAAPSATASHSNSTAGISVATLAGEWRVAGVDGGELHAGHALSLSATGDAIDFYPDCAGADRHYAIDGLKMRTWVADAERVGPVCEVGLPEGTAEMWRAIDAATRIERTEANGVLLSGGGHSLLLFSQ